MADQATQGAIEHDRSSMARFDPQNGELTTISSPDCWVNLCRFEGILRVCSATIGRLKVDWTAGRRGRSVRTLKADETHHPAASEGRCAGVL
jgi:hypothetical protein